MSSNLTLTYASGYGAGRPACQASNGEMWVPAYPGCTGGLKGCSGRRLRSAIPCFHDVNGGALRFTQVTFSRKRSETRSR